MVKCSIQQEELTIQNIYASNTGSIRFVEQVIKDLQRNLASPNKRGDFDTPLDS